MWRHRAGREGASATAPVSRAGGGPGGSRTANRGYRLRLPLAWPTALVDIAAKSGLREVAWQLALELGKVTGDHSDVETPQDRLLGLAIKQELKRSLDAMLRRMHSHRQSFASVSCHRDVMASLARSHTDHDLEFEWIAFAGSLDLDHSLPSP